jgi:predicted nucleic acid-binding Zn ribbon protein
LSNKISNAKRLSYEHVKNEFEIRGCVLLSKEYNGTYDLLDYICECGNKSNVTYNSFIYSNVRCEECGKKKFKEKLGLSYEYVKEQFENAGCKLLSDHYINSNTLLDYICSCGNVSKISYDNFRDGHRCYECSGKTAWDYEKVKQYFEDNGCILLSTEYHSANDKLDYICECGNEHSIKLSMFLYGRRCKKCGIEKITGENNWNWNGGISTILQYFRQRTLKWKKDSMFHSNYKCVITGKRFNVIHHLHGFDQIINEAFANLNITKREKVNEYNDEELNVLSDEIIRLHEKYPLGVCFTDEIHEEFHKLYGYGKNTPEQFYEFYRMKTGKEYKQQPLNNAI